MGTEFSVFLAQWVLAYYEYRFINELIYNKAWGLLAMFKFIVRYIDDILALDCPVLHELAYQTQTKTLPNGNVLQGIYPTGLTLNKEHSLLNAANVPSNLIPMLDMCIQYSPHTRTLITSLYDNRESPKLSLTPITKLSTADTMMSASMSTNIMYSSACRIYSVSMRWWEFADSVGAALYELHRAGRNFVDLHKQLCRFFRNKGPLFVDRVGRDNHAVHKRICERFRRAEEQGLPLLEWRNQRGGFRTRTPLLTPVIWPAHPRLYDFHT